MTHKDPDLSPWLSEVRRDLHRHPEISHKEERTTEKIVGILEGLGIEVQRFQDMTGAAALIRGAEDGPTLGLRADIDALPIQELGDVPYKSTIDGVMHACGHDANTTIMLGVAKRVMEADLTSRMKGHVKFIFQPAEERGAGAKAMIARGVLENPRLDRVIAGHMSTDLPVGSVGVFRGLGYASADHFVLEILGKGSHGGRPEEGIDPIVAGSYFVTHVQSILGRNIKPTEAAVISVGKFRAGDVGNVIPEKAQLEGTIRTLSEVTRKTVFQRLQEIVSALEKTFLVTCRFNLHEGIPPCVNDDEVAAFLYQVSESVLGPDKVEYLPPIMGAEDFGFFTRECPGAIMRLGCSNKEKGLVYPLHSPHFDIDEEVLEIGVAIFYEAIERYLGK